MYEIIGFAIAKSLLVWGLPSPPPKLEQQVWSFMGLGFMQMFLFPTRIYEFMFGFFAKTECGNVETRKYKWLVHVHVPFPLRHLSVTQLQQWFISLQPTTRRNPDFETAKRIQKKHSKKTHTTTWNFSPDPATITGCKFLDFESRVPNTNKIRIMYHPPEKGMGKWMKNVPKNQNTGAFFWTYPFSTETMEVLGERVTWGKKTCKSRKRAKVWQKSRYHHFGFSTLSQIH